MRTESGSWGVSGRRRCGYPAREVDNELRDQCVLGSRTGLQEKLIQLAASNGDKLTLAEVRQARFVGMGRRRPNN